MQYTHITVNHRVAFLIHTNKTIHTQAVERFWGDLKDKIRGRGHGRTIFSNIFANQYDSSFDYSSLTLATIQVLCLKVSKGFMINLSSSHE